MEREERAVALRLVHGVGEESTQRPYVHDRRVDHLAGEQRYLLLQEGDGPVVGEELDPYVGGAVHRGRALAPVEIVCRHVGDAGA